MLKSIVLMLLASALAGCGGAYVVTIPDAVSASGQPAPVTVRLQRQEFWFLRPAVKGAVLRLRVASGEPRAAYTRANGLAAAACPAPEQIGKYAVTVGHQDDQGDEVRRQGNCYVLDPRRLVLAVDWEAVEDRESAELAAGPLARLVRAGVQIVYLATDEAAQPAKAHAHLAASDLPDAPVLSWGWRRDWLGRKTEVTGALPTARKQLPGLVIAAGPEDDLLRAVRSLDMVPVCVGVDRGGRFIEFPDWSELVDRVLAANGPIGEAGLEPMSVEEARDALTRPKAVSSAQ